MAKSPTATNFVPSSPRNNERCSDMSTSSPINSSPPRATQLSVSSFQDRPVSEIISENFPPFDHQSIAVGPFEDETARDIIFEEALTAMLIDSMVECHAWAASRPKLESQTSAQSLERRISGVMEMEKEQERTRERLSEFVGRIKTALEALTGLGGI